MMCKKGVSLREIKYSLGGRGEKRLLVVRVSVKFPNMCSGVGKKLACAIFSLCIFELFFIYSLLVYYTYFRMDVSYSPVVRACVLHVWRLHYTWSMSFIFDSYSTSS